MKKVLDQKGQALVEALVALSLAAVTVSVVVFLVINSLSNTTYTKQQSLATQYAKQGLDFMRNIRDQDYAGFTNYSGVYCLPENLVLSSKLTGFNPSCSLSNGGISGQFIRQINVTPDPATGTQTCSGGSLITLAVSWTDSKCATGAYCHNAKLSSCLATNNALIP